MAMEDTHTHTYTLTPDISETQHAFKTRLCAEIADACNAHTEEIEVLHLEGCTIVRMRLKRCASKVKGRHSKEVAQDLCRHVENARSPLYKGVHCSKVTSFRLLPDGRLIQRPLETLDSVSSVSLGLLGSVSSGAGGLMVGAMVALATVRSGAEDFMNGGMASVSGGAGGLMSGGIESLASARHVVTGQAGGLLEAVSGQVTLLEGAGAAKEDAPSDRGECTKELNRNDALRAALPSVVSWNATSRHSTLVKILKRQHITKNNQI